MLVGYGYAEMGSIYPPLKVKQEPLMGEHIAHTMSCAAFFHIVFFYANPVIMTNEFYTKYVVYCSDVHPSGKFHHELCIHTSLLRMSAQLCI